MNRLPRVDGVLVSRHVRHRAAGGKVGKNHIDIVGGQDVRRFGHEVHAAKDDELCAALGRLRCSELRKLQAVANEIGVTDDFVLLVVMPENQQFRAEFGLTRGDHESEFVLARLEIAFWK